MKAWFIIKNNSEVIGNPVGYTTKKGAMNGLIGKEDWIKMRTKYPQYIPIEEMTEELKNSGIYYVNFSKTGYICQNKDWLEKFWNPFVKQNIQFVEKEFEIIFKD